MQTKTERFELTMSTKAKATIKKAAKKANVSMATYILQASLDKAIPNSEG